MLLGVYYQVLKKEESSDQCIKFLDENLNYSKFREERITLYLNDEAYTKALELALEGRKKDKDLGGLVDNWKAYKISSL